MRILLAVHVATIVVASSYLTLGLFATDRARALWAPYALLTLILALAAFHLERTRDRVQRA